MKIVFSIKMVLVLAACLFAIQSFSAGAKLSELPKKSGSKKTISYYLRSANFNAGIIACKK